MSSSVCALVDSDGTVLVLPYEPLQNCAFTLVSHAEYNRLLTSVNVEFKIDAEMFADMVGYLLLSFVTGHALGRVVKALGKV